EMQNFEQRKRLLEYDDVMNQQREVIYDLRLFALEGGEDLKGEVWEMVEHALATSIDDYAPEESRPDSWDLAALRQRLVIDYFLVVEELPQQEGAEHDIEDRQRLEEVVTGSGRGADHAKLQA